MLDIFYDPETWQMVASPLEYRIEPYNTTSVMLIRNKNEDAHIVDVFDRNGAGSCTCGQYLGFIDEMSATDTCKHIRLVMALRRILKRKGSLPAGIGRIPHPFTRQRANGGAA